MHNRFKKWKESIRTIRMLLILSLMVFASSAYSASKTILVVGDSLSAEYGLIRGQGWVALLEKRLQRENIVAAVVNASISGDTTSGGKARLQGLLDRHHPDIVVIELGGNDGLRGLPLAATERNLRDMIAASRQANASVLLVGIRLPANYGRDFTERFFGLYGKLAKETRSVLVPFLLQNVPDTSQYFQADRIHPTSSAHPIMLDNVWPPLKSLLKK